MKRQFTLLCIATLVTAAVTSAIGQTSDVPARPFDLGPASINSATLPAGHAPIDSFTGLAPATQPNVLGSLSVQVVPGTAGGVVAADEPVTVELYHRGTAVKKIETKLDAAGKVAVADIPVMPPVQALVSIKHDGLVQQVVSPELNPDQPIQSIQMKVFESTEQQPEWNIAMQHMIVQWAQDGSGARVTEMLSANTSGDRAWLGTKVGDQRISMTVPLPPQVDNIELGGSFDEQATRIVDGKLVTGGALFPGRSEYRITFTIPAKDGALEFPITTPAPVTNLIVFVPADNTKVTATGLTGGEAVDVGEGSVRMYRAQNLAAGATALLSVKDIKPSQTPEGAAIEVARPSNLSARNLAMGGAFFIALIGAGMILIKKPQAKRA